MARGVISQATIAAVVAVTLSSCDVHHATAMPQRQLRDLGEADRRRETAGPARDRPRCAFVLPSATSSSISDAHPNGNSASAAKHFDPGHFVCVPGGGRTPRGLLVFSPGLAAADYTLFAEAAADTGLAVTVISQPNLCASTCCSLKGLNCSSAEPAAVRAVQQCDYAERMMHLVGDVQWQDRLGSRGESPLPLPPHPTTTHTHPDVHNRLDWAAAARGLPVVAETNSTVGRLKALLSHFERNQTFRSLSSFLDAHGRPRWANITAAGHSCASYYPLLLGTLFKLERVVMTGGVGQPLFGADANRPLMVSRADVYGFVRSSDCDEAENGTQCASLCESCTKTSQTCTFAENENDYRELGLPGQSAVYYSDVSTGDKKKLAKKLGGARQLFDHDICHFKGRPIMTHLCEMCDLQTRRYKNGSAVCMCYAGFVAT